MTSKPSGLDSLRFQRRLCSTLLRITWLLTAIAAAVGFSLGIRTGFRVLLVCLPIIIIEMVVRDRVVRRMEQRRPPRRRPAATSVTAAD